MKKLLLSFSFLILGFVAHAQSWVEQGQTFPAATRGISEINIIDPNTVWCLGYDGADTNNNIQEFTRTIDGGATWSAGVIDMGDPTQGINNISAVSASKAWFSYVDSANGLGGVFKTEDGGTSWFQQNPTAFTESGAFCNVVHFFNENVGIAMGDPVGSPLKFEIWRTTDGGDNWTRLTGAAVPNALNTTEYGYNGGNRFVGDNAWLPTNKGRILKSTDQGLTWTVSQAPLTDFGAALPANSGRLSFSTSSNGCLLKTSGTVASPVYTFYTTTNGGTTWSAGTPFTGTYRTLAYVPGTNVMVGTSAGTPSGSAYSIDNGTSWTEIDNGAQRGVVEFINGSTGWCAGFSGVDPLTPEGIYKFSGSLANDQFTASKFSIYPNPANSIVTISSTDADSFNLKVTDLAGKVMSTKELSGIENTIDVSSFATGVYFFEIKSGKRTDTIKIMKN
jgi:photosystem II stability/assembly factor-like uncharacterized protein